MTYKYNHLRLFVCVFFFLLSYLTYAQKKKTTNRSKTELTSILNSKEDTLKLFSIDKRKNGSVWLKPNTNQQVKFTNFKSLLDKPLGLRNQDVFTEYKTQKDNIGFTHHKYQQYYNNIKVEGGEIIIHEFNNSVTSVNGKYFDYINMPTTPSFSKGQAIAKVKNALGIKKMMYENEEAEKFIKEAKENNNATYKPKAELIIASNNYDVANPKFYLVYKIYIHAEEPYIDETVYLNAINGEVLLRMANSCNLHKYEYKSFKYEFKKNQTLATPNINSISSIGNGETFYNGNQTFTTQELDNGTYILHDGNKIKTYDLRASNYLYNYSDNDNYWGNELFFKRIQINSIENSWYSINESSTSPDIYIKIKNGLGELVYQSQIEQDAQLPFVNGQNIILNNPPYTIEYYEDDFISDDFIFSFILENSEGTHTFSDGLNQVAYIIENSKNPALDVHWGFQEVHSYYETKFQRNSFDGFGATIKAYTNVSNSYASGLPNGAFYKPLEKIFVFGFGDGYTYNPIVTLDIMGHEFTHAITSFSPFSQSGALAESFGDILGTCVERSVLGSSADWSIGSDVLINPSNDPFGINRSLENPKSRNHPDTFKGEYWDSFTLSDNGDVHKKCGVQNYWFYLLCEGGTGTNDLNNSYNVTSIGIEKAQQVVYRNLTSYMNYISDYNDAAQGSIYAAQEFVNQGLFDFTQNDVDQVINAWYAVGVLDSPASNTSTCSGFEVLTEESGTLEDGSGYGSYSPDLDCRWLIKPPGATSITIDFTEFDIENGNDTVIVYEGESESNILLGPISGDQIPASITSTTGAVLIAFSTNSNGSGDGWKLNYTSSTSSLFCDSQINLNEPSGTFTDGSGADSYLPNSSCKWLIAPPGATSIELSVINLNTEANIDEVIVYDGNSTYDDELIRYSGPVNGAPPFGIANSTSGEMLVVFNSNSENELNGWELSYTSDANPYCSGLSTITSTNGSITDGSDLGNYQDYLNCSWLIQPTGATSVTIDFTEFDLQLGTSDGQAYFDNVKIYDGIDNSTEPIGVFYGSNIPNSLTTTGGSVFITFETDDAINAEGWSLNYNANFNDYCSGTTILTQETGSFSDGSGVNNYNENSDCRWLIQPENATSIILNFSEFNTEDGYDGVVIYEGNSISSPILGVYTGANLPSQVVANSNSMLVRFISDNINNNQGWTASYIANISPEGIDNSISNYEIWFNDDYLNKISSSVPLVNTYNIAESINTSNLQTGINTLHIRFKDNNGYWSSVLSEFVYVQKTTSTGINNVIEYEYWFDNDYNNKATGNGSGTNPLILNLNANVSALDKGLHQFHIRIKDEKGAWSSILSEFIYNNKPEGLGSNMVSAYRYWFNDDFENRVSQTIIPESTYMFLEDINISGLPNNTTNYIHFQFKDIYDNWSSVLTEEFLFETLSNEEFDESNFRIFPNPTSGKVDIVTSYNTGTLNVYNSLGKTVLEYDYIPSKINLENLDSGLYIFEIKTEDKVIKKKLVKR